MKQWKCVECGHIVIGGDERPTMNWDDGHICIFEEDDPKQEIVLYRGRRLARGAQVFRVVVTPEREFETPLQHFPLHLSDGFEWGSEVTSVNLKVTIRANELEPIGMIPYFFELDAPRRDILGASVYVMEMKGSEASIVSADGTLASEGNFEGETFGAFFCSPVLLLTGSTPFLPALVAFVGKRLVAVDAISRTFEIDGRAVVFFSKLRDLPTLRAPSIFQSATSAEVGFAVFPIGDANSATLAVEGWIRAHGDTLHMDYTSLWNKIQRGGGSSFEWGYEGSGPADLALAILCDYFGEAPTREQLYIGQSKAQQIYQQFKTALIATLPRGNHWEFNQEDIANWLMANDDLMARVRAYEDQNDG